MARSSGSSPSLFFFALSLASLFFLSNGEGTAFKDLNIESSVIHFISSYHAGNSCERVRVTGTSRINLKHYASSLHVTLKAFDGIPEKLHGDVQVCSHRNVSLGLCQCENGEWKTLQKGEWSTVISPFEKRYIDVKVMDKLPGSITVTAEEEFQQWRLICLGFGFLLLLLAPTVSTWVPFYVCSSMAVGVLAVVLLLAFQLMKLLPMGRKSVLYITLYGSVLGVGSYIAQYFTSVVNAILVNFGLSEEMHYPVSVMILVFTVLAGAALGYWVVRKYVISEDGSIDAGVAHFVKWAMRVLGVVSILQSSLDRLLPVSALGIYGCICFLSKKWRSRARLQLVPSKNRNLWQPRTGQTSDLWQPKTGKTSGSSSRRTEFLSRSPNNDSSGVRKSSRSPYGRSSPYMRAEAQAYSSPRQRSAVERGDYYSSFHKTPTRRYSKAEWDDFTRESTNEALGQWASSPEVASWITENARRLRLDPDPDHVSDASSESSSDSSDETVVENGIGRGLLHWY